MAFRHIFHIPVSAISVDFAADSHILGFIRVTFDPKTYQVWIKDLRDSYDGRLVVSPHSAYIVWDGGREPEESGVRNAIVRYCVEEVFRG